MANGGDLQIEGLEILAKGLDRFGEDATRAALEGMERGALSMIADAKRNLRENTSVVTGMLRASGKVQRVEGQRLSLDAGFFSTRNSDRGYAWYVEFGRKSGKFPPIDELAQWAYKKFHLHGKDGRKESRSIGFLVARAIAKHGTRPHPFFVPAVERNWTKMQAYVVAAVKRVMK